MSRRTLLLRVGLGGAAALGVGGAYARYFAPFRPEIERVDLDLPGLDQVFVGYRIVQLSDLHAGDQMPVQYLRDQVARAAALRPDLMVVTGDFLTNGDPRSIPVVAEVLSHAKAPDGVLAVLGNHDYHYNRSGPRLPYGKIAADLTTELTRADVRVLRNASHTIHRNGARVQIVGTDDWWRGFYDARKAFAQVDHSAPCIALQHNPDAVFDLLQQPCHWILSGHTHGGQVRIPGIGALYLPVDHPEFCEGRFQVKDKTLYVNRGLGYIFQIRLNCAPEITEFVLKRRQI